MLRMPRYQRGLTICVLGFLFATSTAQGATVHVRCFDSDTDSLTPVMVCITNVEKGTVHLPPDGRVMEKPTGQIEFYKGIRFQREKNWIGPVRHTVPRGKKNAKKLVPFAGTGPLAYWNEPAIYQTSGDFTIELAAGKWRLAIDHGMEYLPIFEEFTIGDEKEITKTYKLERWIDLPQRGWYSGDIHVHHSSMEPAQREYLMRYAMASDVHVVNLLEMGDSKALHFRQAGFGKRFRMQWEDYCLVPGQEDPRSTFGHMIGLNISRLARDLNNYDLYDVAVDRIHKQGEGALIGFAHFAWNGCDLPRGFPWYVTFLDLDFLELLQFKALNHGDYRKYLNLGFRLTAAAGSDVPWGATIGEARTYVYTGPKFDVDAWFMGIKKGNTFVSNGPVIEFTVNGQLPGTEISGKAGDTVKVVAKVTGHPKIAIPKKFMVVGNEGNIKEITNEDKKTELTIEFEHPIDQSQWLAARTVCYNKAVAHTTPVYVVVDGRPTWCPQRGPKIIQEQLDAIAKIDEEFAEGKDERSKGIRERLQKAKKFYAQLLREMAQ